MRNRQQQGEKPGPPDMGAPDSPTPPSSGLASLDMSNDPLVLNASVKACSKLCFDGLDLVFDVNEIEEFGDSPSEVARLTLTLPPSFKGDDPPQNLVDLPVVTSFSHLIWTHSNTCPGLFFLFSSIQSLTLDVQTIRNTDGPVAVVSARIRRGLESAARIRQGRVTRCALASSGCRSVTFFLGPCHLMCALAPSGCRCCRFVNGACGGVYSSSLRPHATVD